MWKTGKGSLSRRFDRYGICDSLILVYFLVNAK